MLWPLLPLRERVINAWIGSDQSDLSESDHVLEVIDLCRTPTPVRYRSRNTTHQRVLFVSRVWRCLADSSLRQMLSCGVMVSGPCHHE